MDMLVQKLGEMGMRISPDGRRRSGRWRRGRLRSVDVSTLPYPGVATDYKPLLVAMLAVADGVGIVTENLFAGRFRYVDELVRMGADIRTEGHHAVVRGVPALSGAPVRAHDIRAGAALVVAGLAAEGETVVADADHIDRGYEDFVGKLPLARRGPSERRTVDGIGVGGVPASRPHVGGPVRPSAAVGQPQQPIDHQEERHGHHGHLVPAALMGQCDQ